MLTRKKLELVWHINVSCLKCIRTAKYFKVVSGVGSNRWKFTQRNLWNFTQNCYGGICVIHWCQVFGNRSERTHYSHLFDDGTISVITKEQITERLRNKLGMNEQQYNSLWEEVKKARDKYFVHYDFDTSDRPVFPKLDHLVDICLEMREITFEIINSEKSEDPEFQMKIKNDFSRFKNKRLLSVIEKESHRLENAVKCKQTTEQGTGTDS